MLFGKGLRHQQQTAFENIVGKEEIALFPQCFLLNQIILSPVVNIYDIISLFVAVLEEPKIGISGKGLLKWEILVTYEAEFNGESLCLICIEIIIKWVHIYQSFFGSFFLFIIQEFLSFNPFPNNKFWTSPN